MNKKKVAVDKLLELVSKIALDQVDVREVEDAPQVRESTRGENISLTRRILTIEYKIH